MKLWAKHPRRPVQAMRYRAEASEMRASVERERERLQHDRDARATDTRERADRARGDDVRVLSSTSSLRAARDRNNFTERMRMMIERNVKHG